MKSKTDNHPKVATASIPKTRRNKRKQSPGAGQKNDQPARVTKPMPNLPAQDPWERDSYASTALSTILNRSTHAAMARFTLGLSPAALAEAYFDWRIHLQSAPGKQLQLVEKAWRKWFRLMSYIGRCATNPDNENLCIDPLPQDRRFSGDAWQKWPYNALYQTFLLQQQWWSNATTGVPGVTRQHERELEFAARQLLDVLAPSNYLSTNPELIEKTKEEFGTNLVR